VDPHRVGDSVNHLRGALSPLKGTEVNRFWGDTVWCHIETAAYDLEWLVGDLATPLFGSDGMSNGYDNEKLADTAEFLACVSL